MNGTAKQQQSHVVLSSSSVHQDDLGSCTWINWKSKTCWVHQIPDPTRMFSILCLFIMHLRYYSETQNIITTLQGFWFHPLVLFYFGSACIVAYLGCRVDGTSTNAATATTPTNTIIRSTPTHDRWTAEWYWWNSWLFHAVMDGSSGSLRLIPLVVYNYDILDLRFPNQHVVPWMIGMFELVVMYPLCLLTMYAVLANTSWRFPLELITSSVQFMGMVVFVGAELYEGQVNIPALDPVGDINSMWSNVKFDVYHLTYYWFGFWFCNLIWGLVPYYRMYRAVAECARAIHLTKAVKSSKAQ